MQGVPLLERFYKVFAGFVWLQNQLAQLRPVLSRNGRGEFGMRGLRATKPSKTNVIQKRQQLMRQNEKTVENNSSKPRGR
jgi:hypothetical protein